MPRAINWRLFVQKLRRLGFVGPYAGGRYLFMVRGSQKLRVPNPHRGDISAPLAREILRQASITPREWEEL